jgi:hypothetical protein
VRPKPYWRTLRPGELHLGYCRRRKSEPGYWTVRTYVGVNAVAPGKSGSRRCVVAMGFSADRRPQGEVRHARQLREMGRYVPNIPPGKEYQGLLWVGGSARMSLA